MSSILPLKDCRVTPRTAVRQLEELSLTASRGSRIRHLHIATLPPNGGEAVSVTPSLRGLRQLLTSLRVLQMATAEIQKWTATL